LRLGLFFLFLVIIWTKVFFDELPLLKPVKLIGLLLLQLWLLYIAYVRQLDSGTTTGLCIFFFAVGVFFKKIRYIQWYVSIFWFLAMAVVVLVWTPSQVINLSLITISAIACVLIYTFGISTLHQTQSDLRIFEAFLNHDSLGYLLINPKLKLIRFNQEAAQRFKAHTGIELEEGSDIQRVILPNEWANFKLNLIKAFQGTGLTLDHQFNFNQSASPWAEIKYIPVFSEAKKIEYVILSLKDITEKTKALQEVISSEKTLKKIFNALHNGVFLLDESKVLVYFNPLFQQQLEQSGSATPTVGSSIYTASTFFGADKLDTAFAQLNTQKNIQQQVKITTPDGSIAFFEIYWASLAHKSAEFKGFLGITQDITQKIRTDTVLKQSEADFKRLFDYAPIGMCLTNENENIVSVNFAFAKMLGYRVDELIGKNYAELISEEDLNASRIHREQLMRGDIVTYQAEKRLLHKIGKVIYALTNVSLLKDANRDEFQTLRQLIDVTKRKLAEKKVQQNERLLESISKNLREGIFRSTYKGHLIYVNDAFARLFGYQNVEEVLKFPATVFYKNADDRLRLQAKAIKTGFYTNEEVLFQRKDGTVFWGLMNGRVIEGEDDDFRFDGAIVDITEKKKAEEKLRHSEEILKYQNQKLKKINQELDNFVYITAHDIKAPLASILGLIQVFRLEYPLLERNHCILMIERSVNKLNQFITDIVDYSQNSRLSLKSRPIQFEAVVRQIWEELVLLHQVEQIKLFVHIQGDIDFYSDERRIKILIKNLLANAIRYYDNFKQQPFVEVKVHAQPNEAIIQVIDNGIGIDSQRLPKIFNMFYRGSERSQGSGIGLYIVKEVVQILKGSIQVNSLEGVGTTFIISLPNQLDEI
ncbi:MAG TPA: hypothetical protein DCM08_00125, partial [Microscillaceae bacterium]|nr:hypothetical protein [Microscillaceae bacterium]